MSQVYVTLSKEMLQALLANLIDLKFPASDFLVENETDGMNEITRIINLLSGDVFEQAVQKQEASLHPKGECKIYEFPPKLSPGEPFDDAGHSDGHGNHEEGGKDYGNNATAHDPPRTDENNKKDDQEHTNGNAGGNDQPVAPGHANEKCFPGNQEND